MINNLYGCLSSLGPSSSSSSSSGNARFFFCTHENNTLEITKTRSSNASPSSFVLVGEPFPSDSTKDLILGNETLTSYLEATQLPGAGLVEVPEDETVYLGAAETVADETELVNSLAELDSHLDQVQELCQETDRNFQDQVTQDENLFAADDRQDTGTETAYYSTEGAPLTAPATESPLFAQAFRYKCDYCPYATKKKSNCTMHMRCVHLREKFTCHVCDKQVANLNQHMRTTHKVFKTEGEHCSLCNKNSHNLESHNSKTHNIRVEADLTCPVCSKAFLHRSNLVRHQALHVGAKLYCHRCDVHVSNLVKHNISFHPLPSGYPFICGICGLEFTKKSVLLSHRQKHREKSSSKPGDKFCSLCNKNFANITQHIKIVHKKMKNFECVNCKKRFYDKRELRNHHLKYLKNGVCLKSVVSSAEAKYECSLCHYKSAKRSNLLVHQQSVHQGVKHKCPACEKELASRPNLNLHMKNCGEYLALHGPARDSGRIVFLCKLCEYETTRASHLDRHILSVHPTEAVETVTSVYEASKTVPSMYGPGPESSTASSALIQQIASKHLKLPQFANLAQLETTTQLLGAADPLLLLTRRIPGTEHHSTLLAARPPLPGGETVPKEESLSHLEAGQLSQLEDPAAASTSSSPPLAPLGAAREEEEAVARALNAASFVNPARLVNQPTTSGQPLRDWTMGQHQLMDLAGPGQRLAAGDQPPPSSSPLGSTGADLMCAVSLGDYVAPDEEEAVLFSLPLPLCGDMHS